MILEILFWTILGIIIYAYCLYPIFLFLVMRLKGAQPPVQPISSDPPRVSIVISLYNEEKSLPKKIENLRSINYPIEKLEFLFGSDGSTDATNAILRQCSLPNLRMYAFPARRGKARVLNELVPQATGEVVVFSDGNTLYAPDTVQQLVKHFESPEVGAVCGELVLESGPGSIGGVGESSYWKYENFLKRMESSYRTILGATGGVYAIRKRLFQPLPTSKPVTDDFLIPMNVIGAGFSVKYEPQARAFEDTLDSIDGEFRRKVRIGAQNFYAIAEFAHLLHPRHGFVAFALWSHKIARWCAPILLAAIFILNGCLSVDSTFYEVSWLCQLGFISLGLVGFFAEKLRMQIGILGYPYYFLAMNAALFVGFLRFLSGRQRPTWDVLRSTR